MAAAVRLQPPGLHDNSLIWPDYGPAITKHLWNSGRPCSSGTRFKACFCIQGHLLSLWYGQSVVGSFTGLEGSKLDFHLCHAVNAADQQASMGLVCQEEVLSARLNFVYFLLFSQRQLARAAKILMQVVCLLSLLGPAVMCAHLEVPDRFARVIVQVVQMLATIMQPGNHGDPDEPETILHYNGWDTIRVAASAGSFLVELLHMRTASTSPMSVKSPREFLEACQGEWAIVCHAQKDVGQMALCKCSPCSVSLLEAVMFES